MTEYTAHEIFRLWSFFGLFFILLYAIGIFAVPHKRPEQWPQAGLFVTLALIEWGAFNTKPGLDFIVTELALAETPFLYLIGPFFLAIRRGGIRHIKIVHWLPALAAFAVMTPFFFSGASVSKPAILSAFFKNGGELSYLFIYALGGASIFVYAVKIVFDYRAYFKPEILAVESPFQALLLIALMAISICAVGFFGIVFREFLFVRVAAAIIPLGGAVLFVMGFRHPSLHQYFQSALEQPKKLKSALKQGEATQLATQLQTLMEERELWRDEDLSLAALADELQTGIHQLSELLNRELGSSFAIYVNDFRVKAAQARLIASDDNALDIALECGFNSKASFNRHFSRVTGMSPMQFKQRHAGG